MWFLMAPRATSTNPAPNGLRESSSTSGRWVRLSWFEPLQASRTRSATMRRESTTPLRSFESRTEDVNGKARTITRRAYGLHTPLDSSPTQDLHCSGTDAIHLLLGLFISSLNLRVEP